MRLFAVLPLAAVGLTAIASSPVAAMSNCTWSLGGTIELQQSNGIMVILMLEHRSDGKLFGTGEFHQSLTGKIVGSLDGSLDGDNIQFNIYWPGGNAVIYRFHQFSRARGGHNKRSVPPRVNGPMVQRRTR